MLVTIRKQLATALPMLISISMWLKGCILCMSENLPIAALGIWLNHALFKGVFL